MKNVLRTLALVTIATSMTACAGLDKALTGNSALPDRTQREAAAAKFSTLTPEQKKEFIDGNPFVGMSSEQLEALWGNDPSRKQKKLTEKGAEEIRIYAVRIGDWKTGIRTQLYKVRLLGSKVTEIQEIDNSGLNLEQI